MTRILLSSMLILAVLATPFHVASAPVRSANATPVPTSRHVLDDQSVVRRVDVPQETPAKRLSAIVGVAVDEYGKAVDATGQLVSAVELEECTGFLRDAQNLAQQLATANAALTRALLDSLVQTVLRRSPPGELRGLRARFDASLGADGVLDQPTRAITLAEGRALFVQHCAACHGATGNADGAQAVRLDPKPARLSDARLLRDATPSLLYRIVSVGVPGTAMVPWSGTLTSDQRWAVVWYVNTLRGSDRERLQGTAVLATLSERSWMQFEWLVEHSDAELAVAIAGAVAAADVPAVVAALRATPIAGQRRTPHSATDAARDVAHLLDAALALGRAGDRTGASDRAFDAYLAFEALEGPARARDANLIAAMERHFGDFRGAVRGLDMPAASAARAEIARGLPRVIELAQTASSGWGAFFESLVIILREGFEAILVIGAMAAFLLKTGNRRRLRDLWIGAGTGLGASVGMAVVLDTTLKALPASRELIEGGTMLVAVIVLFFVSYWLLSKMERARWQAFIRERVDAALSTGGATALAVVAFLAVFREGAETALFYQVLLARAGTTMPVVFGLLAGCVGLGVLFTLFYRFGVRIPLRPFFATTSGLLYLMAFVFAGNGIKELQEGNALSVTPVPGVPHVEVLGIHPTVETLAAQGLLVALLLLALWKALQPQEVEEAAAAGATDEVPPDVASRLAVRTVAAGHVQQRDVAVIHELEAHDHKSEADDRPRTTP